MPKQVTQTQTEEEESPLPIRVPQTYRLPQRLARGSGACGDGTKDQEAQTMVATGDRSRGDWGMAPAIMQASKQTSLHSASTLPAAVRGRRPPLNS